VIIGLGDRRSRLSTCRRRSHDDARSGNVTKLATLEAGLEIGVPLFSKEGEKR
jgi:hypothetical protein